MYNNKVVKGVIGLLKWKTYKLCETREKWILL
jgi:hypothetical protein